MSHERILRWGTAAAPPDPPDMQPCARCGRMKDADDMVRETGKNSTIRGKLVCPDCQDGD